MTEKNIDFQKGSSNGEITYHFKAKKGISSKYPYTAPDHSSTLDNGQLLSKRVYNADHQLLMSEENSYQPPTTASYKSIIGLKLGPPLTTYNDNYVWGYKKVMENGCEKIYYAQDCDYTLLNVYEGYTIVRDLKEVPVRAYKEKALAQYTFTSARSSYLVKSVVREYNGRLKNSFNYLETTKTYEYVNEDPLYAPLVRSVTTTTSRNNEWLKEVNYYPFDNHSLLSSGSTATYAAMKNRHWIGKVVGKQTLRLEGSDLASATATPIHQLREDYKIAVGNQLQLDQVAVALDGQNLAIRLKEFTYDTEGNLLGYQKDGFYTALQWGYQGLYPTAQIVGAQTKDCFYTSFEGQNGGGNSAEAKTGQKSRQTNQVLNLASLTNGKYVLSYWQKNGPVWTEQKSIHEVTSGSFQHTIVATAAQPIDEVRFYPLGAQMTTYTYLPGIGQSSVTAPNGQAMYYSYDQLGRLLYTRDFEKNILQTYEYHFKND